MLFAKLMAMKRSFVSPLFSSNSFSCMLYEFPFRKLSGQLSLPYSKSLITCGVNHYNRPGLLLVCFIETVLAIYHIWYYSWLSLFGDGMRILSAEVLRWWSCPMRGFNLNASWNMYLAVHVFCTAHMHLCCTSFAFRYYLLFTLQMMQQLL